MRDQAMAKPSSRSIEISKPEMINVDQAAKLLGVSRRQLERLIHTGSLPGSVKLGVARRIHGPTLREWIAAGRPPV